MPSLTRALLDVPSLTCPPPTSQEECQHSLKSFSFNENNTTYRTFEVGKTVVLSTDDDGPGAATTTTTAAAAAAASDTSPVPDGPDGPDGRTELAESAPAGDGGRGEDEEKGSQGTAALVAALQGDALRFYELMKADVKGFVLLHPPHTHTHTDTHARGKMLRPTYGPVTMWCGCPNTRALTPLVHSMV